MTFLASGLDKAVLTCVGLFAIAFGAPPPGTIEATVGLAGTAGYFASRQQKFGPECARVRKKTREGIRKGFAQMLEVEGDHWSAHDDLAKADAALEQHLEACVIDRGALAKAVVSQKGFPGEAADMVMAALAKHEPQMFGQEATLTVTYNYARNVIEICLRAALENRQYYEALEPHIINELGKAVGTLMIRAEQAAEHDKAAAVVLKEMAARLERMERAAHGPELTPAQSLGFARTVLEREVPDDQLAAALSEITKNYFSMRSEIETLVGLSNEAPEIRPYLEAASTALNRDDMIELEAAEIALKEIKKIYDARVNERRALEGKRREKEDRLRLEEDRMRAQIAEALATAAAARLDRYGAAAHYGEAAGLWPENTRERMLAFAVQGDVLWVAGDTAGAMAAFGPANDIADRLAKADPSSADRARDLSVSLNKIGNVRQAQGDLAGALTAYTDSMDIRDRLAKADPSSADRARDLSVGLSKIGDVRGAQGDLAGALTAYTDSMDITDRLAKADPSSADRARDVLVSYSKLATIDLENAVEHWRQVVKILEAMQSKGILQPVDEKHIQFTKDELQKALDLRNLTPSSD
jgi:tetratricopeptide (TPR) repeat protein